MGKGKKGRGGGSGGNWNNNRGNGNGNGNGNNWNNNNNRGGKKNCKNCGPNNSHDTSQCFKNKNNRNNSSNNNKIDKHNKNNNQENQKLFCNTCEFWNHDSRSCKASELDEQDQCPCGNTYHYANKCPWNQDPDEREKFLTRKTGKICQWCKGDGDGTHDFTDCIAHKKFRADLLAEIKRCYDKLNWCWHCGEENHKTRACDKPIAAIGKTEWEGKINRIVKEWTAQDLSMLVTRYREDEDVAMSYGMGGPNFSAPVASSFIWCLYCQEFGHVPDPQSCDTTEYERKRPAHFKHDDSFVATKPFVPNNMTARQQVGPSTSSWLPSGTNYQDPFRQSVMKIDCRTPGCPTQFIARGDPSYQQSWFCTRCEAWTQHPYLSARKDSQDAVRKEVKTAIMVYEAFNSIKNGGSGMKKKSWQDIYKFRPSIALPVQLAVERWPEEQPPYTDLNAIPEDSDVPLFKRDKDYFNEPGNHQYYFPPTLFKVTQQFREIQADDTQPINKGGRMGLELQCTACGTLGVVRDDEGDLVMCGVDPACTVGCGKGWAEWAGVFERGKCRCITITGRQPKPMWVLPAR